MGEIVVFDWGGVLIRGLSELYTKLAKDTNRSLDQTRDSLYGDPHRLYMMGKITYEEWVTNVRDSLAPDSDLKEFSDSLYRDYLYRYIRIDEEVFRILNRVKEERCPVVALSNTSEVIVWVMKDKFPGLYFSFLRLYLSHEMGCLKPDLKIYQMMINDLIMQPGQLTFIDDKEENIVAAKSLGINGILYENPGQLEGVLFK